MGCHRLKKLIYSSQDWSLMQTALLLASKQFEPPNYPHADRLARRVMALFDEGLRDAETLASAAAHQERLIAQIALVRDTARQT
jgi:hypothetical protein